MNHTERIIHVARQVRGLTRERTRQAVELYLASVAEEAATGESVVLPSIGRLQLVCHRNYGQLHSRLGADVIALREPGYRVQARLHLADTLKASTRSHLLPGSGDSDTTTTRVGPEYAPTTRIEPGLPDSSIAPRDQKER